MKPFLRKWMRRRTSRLMTCDEESFKGKGMIRRASIFTKSTEVSWWIIIFELALRPGVESDNRVNRKNNFFMNFILEINVFIYNLCSLARNPDKNKASRV